MKTEPQIDRADDHATFRRLAVNRVNKATKYIRLIGNLSNRSNYSYKPQDVKTIFKALKAEIDAAELRFEKSEIKKFTLE